MKSCAFLPWIRIANPFFINGFWFIPYSKNSNGNFKEGHQSDFNEILDSYFNNLTNPKHSLSPSSTNQGNVVFNEVEECVLIVKDKNEIFFESDDSDDSDDRNLFNTIEYICFSFFCCSRQIFDSHTYINRANFHCIIQPFNKGSIALKKRRIDGKTIFLSQTKDLIFLRPQNCHDSILDVDVNFLSNLITLGETIDTSDQIFDGIKTFNSATLDDPNRLVGLDAGALYGCLEKFLSFNKGVVGGFGLALLEQQLKPLLLSNYLPKPINTSPRYHDIQQSSFYTKNPNLFSRISVTDAWIKDFNELRNFYNHGNIHRSQLFSWSASEHLLFTSFLIPIIVKLFMQNNQLYKLNNRDKLKLEKFEDLITLKDPAQQVNHIYVWKTIINDTLTDQHLLRSLGFLTIPFHY